MQNIWIKGWVNLYRKKKAAGFEHSQSDESMSLTFKNMVNFNLQQK